VFADATSTRRIFSEKTEANLIQNSRHHKQKTPGGPLILLNGGNQKVTFPRAVTKIIAAA
jgi:hypothetical protein